MLKKAYDWIDERLNVTPLWRDVADHDVPAHVNPAVKMSAFIYCFGGLTFLVITHTNPVRNVFGHVLHT